MPEQAHDLLNFRKIRQEEFQAHINYCILRDASVSPPEHLHMFASTKAQKKKEKTTRIGIASNMHEKDDGDVFKRRKYASDVWVTVYTTTPCSGWP